MVYKEATFVVVVNKKYLLLLIKIKFSNFNRGSDILTL
mgnify:CR=1 FL=1